MKQPLVSVIIPAYNKPEYTRKTLQSIVEQEYRPIEVILSDDCSPTSLEPLVEEFRRFENDLFTIKFYRQESNLGVMGNFTFCLDQATGKYMIPFAHDNWFIDKQFMVEAVGIMETNPACYICVANAKDEETNDIMLEFPGTVDAEDKWAILEGDVFINMWGLKSWGSMGWTQATILNFPVARSLGAFQDPFFVSESLANRLDILADNGFSFVFLLSSIGSVAVTGKVVCVSGSPEDSYSKSEGWGKHCNETMFVVYYNLYQAKLDGKYAQSVKKRVKNVILLATINRINVKIIRHYNYNIEAILLMFLSYISGLYKRGYIRYYIDIFRCNILRIRNREFSELKKAFLRARKRGLLRTLLPFR